MHFETAGERWAWHKRSEYQGWTNWETWNTALIMNNDGELQQQAYAAAAQGLEAFAAWGLREVVGPHNAEVIRDHQEWTDEEEVAAMMENDLEKWMADAQRRYPDDVEARRQYVEKMRSMIYGLMGQPQPSDINQSLIEDSKVNWEEIYQHFIGE